MALNKTEYSMSSIVYALTPDPRLLENPQQLQQAQQDALNFCRTTTMFLVEGFDPRAVAANPEQAQADLIEPLFM